MSGGSTSTRVTTPIETTTGESFIFAYANYRYAFGIQHNGTGFGLLFLDWYLQGNTNTRNCLLVPVRDVR